MKKTIPFCLAALTIALSVAACTSTPTRDSQAGARQTESVPAVTDSPEPTPESTLNPEQIDFEYTDNGDGTCTVTGYTGEQTGDLHIPGEVNGLTVTAIGDMAFNNCSGFTGGLIIPEGVIKIGKSACWNCRKLSGTLTIPESVTTIEGRAFSTCLGFTGELIIPENVTTIGDHAFANCNGFSGRLLIPENVTTIGNRAFCGSNNVTQIEFLGNAPANFGNLVFDDNCHGGKSKDILYDPSCSGWSTPKWNGYDCNPKSEYGQPDIA